MCVCELCDIRYTRYWSITDSCINLRQTHCDPSLGPGPPRTTDHSHTDHKPVVYKPFVNTNAVFIMVKGTLVAIFILIIDFTCGSSAAVSEPASANSTGNDVTTGPDVVTDEPEAKPNPLLAMLLAVSRNPMYKFGMALHAYYLPVLVIVGFTGNALSLAVMTRPHNKKISCCVYMASLAVADNINLFIAIYYWGLTVLPAPVGRKIYQYVHI